MTDGNAETANATATANNIEPLDTKEENEVSLDGFGSANITSTSVNAEQQEDDNKYYRDQAIGEANRKYDPKIRENGNGKGKRNYKNSKSEEAVKIISKSQVYKLGSHFLAEAILIGEHNQPYWITSESSTGQISIQEFIDITDDMDDKQKKLLYIILTEVVNVFLANRPRFFCYSSAKLLPYTELNLLNIIAQSAVSKV